MPTPKKRAITILRKVQALILAEPTRLRMDSWGHTYNNRVCSVALSKHADGTHDCVLQDVPPCGTTACIAGQVVLSTVTGRALLKAAGGYERHGQKVYVEFPSNTDDVAAELLGVTAGQAKRLFFLPFMQDGVGWPEKFAKRYAKARTAKTRAKIAAARIEHFIQTGE